MPQGEYRKDPACAISTSRWENNRALLHMEDFMCDTSVQTATSFELLWAHLLTQGYALTDEEAIGLPRKYHDSFRKMYFNETTLRRDHGDHPVDRQRARDVIRYQWRNHALFLQERETITITDRAGIPGKRDHSRVMLLDDVQAEKLIRILLRLVPSELRLPDGTFGVNLFRTFTNVVTSPHRDGEKFVILYLLGRIGDGAVTYLFDAADPTAKPVLRRQLKPGELVIFDDERFVHDTSPLVPPPGGAAQRDILICTVDHRSTYLEVP